MITADTYVFNMDVSEQAAVVRGGRIYICNYRSNMHFYEQWQVTVYEGVGQDQRLAHMWRGGER